MTKYPVYIPTKGRAGVSTTTNLLDREDIPYKLVVEPQDAFAYANSYGEERVLLLDRDDPGSVVPARNLIKDHAAESGHDFHWQLDDNIKAIRRQRGRKREKCPVELALSSIEDFVERYTNVGAASLRNTAFAFDAKTPFILNNMVYVCMLLRTNLPYRWRIPGAEDVDMSLQILSGGLCTVVTNIFQVEKPPSGSMKGGHQENQYKGDGRADKTKRLARAWPGAVKVERRFGQTRHVLTNVWSRYDTPLEKKED